ncbi:MAG: hypothetical protein PGN09_07550 [Sphingomonas fennica]
MLTDPENPPRVIAADGRPVTPAAETFDVFVRMLEDGQLNRELSDELRKLAGEMANAAIDAGGKAKGKLTLTFDFALEGRIHTIASKYKIDLPVAKRAKSVMWSTEDGRFTPNNPHQGHLFGVREVRDEGGFRN